MAPHRRLFALLLLISLAGCEGTTAIDCRLTMITQIPLRVQDRLLVVPAGINGTWVHLVVDSGAERTTISAAAVARLILPHDPRYKMQSIGIGGTTTSTDVTIDRLVLGGVHFPIERVAAGAFDLHNLSGLDADGLLGADILLAYDIDIDVPAGVLTLYRSRLCPNMHPPWQDPGSRSPASAPARTGCWYRSSWTVRRASRCWTPGRKECSRRGNGTPDGTVRTGAGQRPPSAKCRDGRRDPVSPAYIQPPASWPDRGGIARDDGSAIGFWDW